MNDRIDFDVIVVGSGMSGGWAAKELTEKGLKTLILERGQQVEHSEDYISEGIPPWDMKLNDQVDRNLADKEYYVQKKCYAFAGSTKHFFANDKENPYVQEEDTTFDWIRGYHVGGRSLLWARQSYRWSDLDFNANKMDKNGIDWPIRYKDLIKWYDHVEKFVGVSGSKDGLSQLPDGEFLTAMEMNCAEKIIKKRIEEAYEDRNMIIGRCAHLTDPQPIHTELGRGVCQSRNECQRGCSFGAYFSSQSATLPAATNTGNLTLETNKVVHSLIYDPKTNKAKGVRVIDTITKAKSEYYARVIFMCASTLGTTQILLNSTSERFQNGFANSSNALGHYLMDHVKGYGATGTLPGMHDKYYHGRRPNGIYIPRFKNLRNQTEQFLRGYGFQGSARRTGWKEGLDKPGFGTEFKESFKTPGPWVFAIRAYGEMLPRYKNRVCLHKTKADQWGIPLLQVSCVHGDNEDMMKEDIVNTAVEMLNEIGLQDVKEIRDGAAPGNAVHEMGTARMGHDPNEAVLNAHNQCHDVENVFITDGAAMTSTACQNPSITYMALTARAADYAATQMKLNLL